MAIRAEASEAEASGRALWPRLWSWHRRCTCIVLAGGALACGDIADNSKLPPNVQDPLAQQTPGGAMGRYRAVIGMLPKTYDRLLTETGILTDELAALPVDSIGIGRTFEYTGIDSRTDLSAFAQDYDWLQTLRVQAREARGFVAAYAPDSSSALEGHLAALEGYAELFLADLFCSGIPLSSVDFNSDYTLRPGSTTAAVYEHAVALFDTAVAQTGDSVRLQTFAAIGRGRALLALGRYAEAAAAVAAVPSTYLYQVVFTPGAATNDVGLRNRLLWRFQDTRAATAGGIGFRKFPATPGMADGEGLNGVPYISAADPRTPVSLSTAAQVDSNNHRYPFPNKLAPKTGNVTLTVADGVEARLIEAEAALQVNDGQWLTQLNDLRQTCAQLRPVAQCTPALAVLSDPGTPEARVDLLFRERAFWLYLTAHRQGDLRRLIRQYGRPQTMVYPTGPYTGGGSGLYGTEVVAPVPPAEQQFNPKYAGCINHEA